jgi:uncharacterized protein YecE (DUF72 family)
LPAHRWLEQYARVFDTVELNATFYRLPSEAAVDRWQQGTPPGFLFSCKGSRFLTHMKRLTDIDLGMHRYFDRVLRLGGKLGPVLWQLPPQMARPDQDRLEAFLAALPGDVRHAVEFRHPAWASEKTCALLDAYGAAFCEHDFPGGRAPRPTGGFRYLRFHGTSRYSGRYGPARLRTVARDLALYRAAGGEAFVYFNNDTGGHAVKDAIALGDLLASRSCPPPSRRSPGLRR